MNVKENFENRELPLKNDDLSDSNVTPVSDDAMKENQTKETKEEGIEQEDASSDSFDKSKEVSEPESKDEQDSVNNIAVDTKVDVTDNERAETETVDESNKKVDSSDGLKEEEDTDSSSLDDKKPEIETTESETEEKPEDSTPDEKRVERLEAGKVDESIKEISESDELKEKEQTEPYSSDDKKPVIETTDSETEEKPEDATPDEKRVERLEAGKVDESIKEISESDELKEKEQTEPSSSDDKKPEIETMESETEEKPEDSTPDEKSVEKPEKKKVEKKEGKTLVSKTPEILTFEQIVENLRKLLKKETFSRKELDKAQYLFLNECKKEIDSQKEEFLKAGGAEEDFVLKESDLHTEGKNLLQTLSEKRKQIATNESKVKEKNLERKLAIIEEIKELTDSQEDFNKVYQEFKTLQKEWNSIRSVPHSKEHELWKSYQQHVETFYDRVRLHNEFRDYDFKKNLEQKLGLCESAERLNDEQDVVSAFHQLQKLHKDWRDIGPVARKDRELIWQRFKEISAIINKKYQAHIETLKEKENENYEKKIAICEELEAIDFSALKNTRDWDTKMREVLNLQAVWREIGYAPRKVNAKIFRRYRAACDLFFKNKNEYYQSIRGELEENLKKKIALCERAEEMKDSTDWKETTPKMIAIQREWKEIGMVPRRNSASVWKRFISACDHYFEQKKIHSKSIRETEVENLKLKREVTEKIKNIDSELSKEDALSHIKDLMEEWHSIGFVPYKDKNKAYKEFLDATDAQYARLNIDKSERKLETFKTNISEMTKSEHSRGKVLHERDKLMRQFERMKSELQTYENNIGFLSSSSKKGSVLVDDMNSKIERIKAELELIVKKIDAIDAEI